MTMNLRTIDLTIHYTRQTEKKKKNQIFNDLAHVTRKAPINEPSR